MSTESIRHLRKETRDSLESWTEKKKMRDRQMSGNNLSLD